MLQERTRFIRLCVSSLESKGLSSNNHYKDRLKKEIKEIDAQGEHEYLLKLYDEFKEKKLIFPSNEHNLLVYYLLDLTSEFDIEKEYASVQGEMPDVDIDYIKDVRDYLKRTWAPNKWGKDFICEIGTYGTSGIKSSILDMARVHNLEKNDIQAITVTMEDKDDEGKVLEWDKALEMYPDFKSYCERHPQVAESARLLLDRNRTGGVHAGGLIISSVPIDGFVPLEVRSVNKHNPNGVICSAWPEGLNTQDLQPVGLIKFDMLVINNLMQIAIACKLVKERHGLSSISALPGSWDWSDLAYLNDPKSIEMANSGDLKCIFQFDGEGIRKMVKRGGVTGFDDEAAYSALYRPGPLNMGMDARYCKRKRWEQDKNHPDAEPYNIHPLMKKILGNTYGVLVYQEQVMEILRVVGNIPDMHTEKVRKAISKKKVKDFIKYKEQFIENGQKNLEVNKDFVEDLWNQIESFAEYGFNKSVLMYTKIPYVGGVKCIKDFVPGDMVYCVDETGATVETEVVALHDHGELEGFEVTFDDGYQITCSANHKFLTEKGQVSLSNICRTRSHILSTHNNGCDASEVEYGMFSFFNGCDEDRDLGLGAGHAPITDTGNLVPRKIVRVVPVGKCHMFDLEVANPTHNFLLPNGVVTSNSHACAYTYISARLLWLKSHYPLEFYAAILMCEDDQEKFKQVRIDAKAHSIEICPVQINRSKENFNIEDGKIYFGFSNIKGIGVDVAKKIVEHQPYKSLADFLNRFGTDASVLKPLISLGVFEEPYDRLTLRKFSEFYRDKTTKRRQRAQRFDVSLEDKKEELKTLLMTFLAENDENYKDPLEHLENPDLKDLCEFTPEADVLWKKNFETNLVSVPFKYRGEERVKQVSGYKILTDLAKKYETTVTNFQSKEVDDDDNPTVIDKFDSSKIALDEDEEFILKNERWMGEEKTFPAAENLYYGFEWVHELETCSTYQGMTLDKFLEETKNENPVEIRVEEVRKRTSKSGTIFYSVDIEDANSKRMVVNVWKDDMDRWKDEIKAGNLLRMRVRPPSGGFNTLTFLSCPRHEKARTWPNKENDPRVILLTPPEPKKPLETIYDDFGLTDEPGWEQLS